MVSDVRHVPTAFGRIHPITHRVWLAIAILAIALLCSVFVAHSFYKDATNDAANSALATDIAERDWICDHVMSIGTPDNAVLVVAFSMDGVHKTLRIDNSNSQFWLYAAKREHNVLRFKHVTNRTQKMADVGQFLELQSQ